MTAAADIFGLDDVEELPRRDRYGRPLLLPRLGGDRVAYTRASSLANMISDTSSLDIWAQNQIVVGMGQRPDLVALASTLPPLHDEMVHKDRLDKVQKQQDIQTKKELRVLREAAREQAKASFKARMGTAVHAACEPGADHTHAVQSLIDDAAGFRGKLAEQGIETFAHETFCVNDDLLCAGSFDYLVLHPTLGPVILDIKTGSVDVNDGLKFAVQLAVYANSQVYDVHDDTRAPLEALTSGEQVNRKVGIVAHVALGTGETRLYTVDLEIGLHAARLATRVREARKVKNVMAVLA